jgi:putative MATE family efflux protein
MSTGAPERSLTRVIWALSWPIAGANFLLRGVGIIDTALVGRLGGTALAAVGISQIIIFVAFVIIRGLAVGGQVMVAFHTGAKNPARARAAAGATLTSGIVFSVLAMWVMPKLSPTLAQLMGAPPDVIEQAVAFLDWIWVFIVFRSLLILTTQIFQGYGDSRTPLWVTSGVTVVHVLIAYPLVFGLWGFDQWGVAGASFATGISECLGVIVLWAIGIRRKFINLRVWAFTLPDLVEVWRTGYPASGERLFMTSMQFAFARILNQVSVAAFAAFRVGVDIQAFSFLPGLGFANAATTLVGLNLGAKNQPRAKKSALLTLWMTYGYMIVLGLTYFFLGEYWYRAFTTDPDVIHYGTTFMKFAGYQQIPLAAAMVLSGALRGAGENRWVMYASLFFGWGVRIPLAFLTTSVLGWSVQWAWFTVSFDWTIRAVWMYLKFRSDNWRLSPGRITRPSDAMPPREVFT